MFNVIVHALWVAPVLFFGTQIDTRLVAMRFFRDLSRSKARRRLHGNNYALVPMILGIEDPIELKEKTETDIEMEDALTLTSEELASYTGKEGSPLYLAIDGRVYDVSAGTKFYGEGGSYHKFVGKDATYAFATGCLQEECLVSTKENLTEKEKKEIQRWIELYDTHDKYKFVGHIVADPVAEILEREENNEKETVHELL